MLVQCIIFISLLNRCYSGKVSPIASTNFRPKFFPGIPHTIVQQWAEELSQTFLRTEKTVVRREELQKSFGRVKMATRSGAAIVEEIVTSLEKLLTERAQAARKIMLKAEQLSSERSKPPSTYVFDKSLDLDKHKPNPEKAKDFREKVVNCTSRQRVELKPKSHFGDVGVSLQISSVQVSQEVFDCDDRVLPDIYWSEKLLETFQSNHKEDSRLDFQYFCSAKGFLRHYPAAEWSSFFKINLNDYDEDIADVYDCRLRPWYVAAGGAPRDILVLFDATGSMNNTANEFNGETFTQALLTALTDDDQVNVLRFNRIVESPIACFNDKLVSSNHANTAAMITGLKSYWVQNYTKLDEVLVEAVAILKKEQGRDPPACQKAIVLIADSIPRNYTEIMRRADPAGRIRLFVIWLHDPFGLRDGSHEYGEALSCAADGHFAELVTSSDVTEQVMHVLRVLERPLVAQRKERLTVFSDLYAHIEDPRRSEYYWTCKEKDEQKYRYTELRKNKDRFLSGPVKMKHFLRQQSLNTSGQYYEGESIRYRFQISVSIPVFDDTTSENITVQIAEEKARKATRTYPVNRLLGVAGVDIPIDHLRLILPIHKVGSGGSLFIIDHRGKIVLHDNLRPVFDGDILKPGYRTVDFIDLEQPAENLAPRNYTKEWLKFRKRLLIDDARGSKTMAGKYIIELGMRSIQQDREYFWGRILDHYTAVVVLPKYNRKYPMYGGSFTQELARKTGKPLTKSNLAVHPDWLYCKHIDAHFDEPEFEVRHFVMRREQEDPFPMRKIKDTVSDKEPMLWDKPYQCNEELMVRLCTEAVATDSWSREEEDVYCNCELGAVTAFFATESGLTRWNSYRTVSAYRPPPSGREWPRGPDEPWYIRAVAAPNNNLVIHAPVLPIQRFRRAEDSLPPRTNREKWLTAARVLPAQSERDGILGVAGFHFHPKHLENVLKAISDFGKEESQYRCDGTNWTCVLVDDGAWVVGGHYVDDEDIPDEGPIREHLSRLHPHAMKALLNAKVFELNWVHDYQGVCFPAQEEGGASVAMPTILMSIWRSAALLIRIARELVTLVAVLNTSIHVSAETQQEREKRRNHTRRAGEREKYELLYNDTILVNKTRFAACDRSRPLYVLTSDPAKLKLLEGPADPCRWPLVGAPVPDTNLLLLAIMSLDLCSPSDETAPSARVNSILLPDPFVNQPVPIEDQPGLWLGNTSASRMACWRNLVPLPARAPHSVCYPHDYEKELGYRQCGPWIPDAIQPKEPEEDCHAIWSCDYDAP